MPAGGRSLNKAALAGLALAALAGCGQPEWMATREPLPDPPAWSQPFVGRPLSQGHVLAPDEACAGMAEQVEIRYRGPRPGSRLLGWGWDGIGRAPVAGVLITDPDGLVVGAGESGLARPDVPAARSDVTSGATGWWALTTRTEGPVEVYGVLADGRACLLGRIRL